MTETQQTIPRHLGIILDGNRRWARDHNVPTLEGHRKGEETLKTIAKAAFKSGIEYVSAFVFSTENWKRSAEEVDYLMKLLLWVAKNEVKELDKENIRVRFLGGEDRLSKEVLKAVHDAETRTERNTGGTLLICLNYGGQQEIAMAATKAMQQKKGEGTITTQDIEHNLYAADVPPIDLLLRTSGEHRISNFMLWRAAYSELLFVDKHWPDFNEEDLAAAIEEFSCRQRRFGA